MNSAFRKSFARDLKKIKDKDILERIQKKIQEVEEAVDLHGISQLKKMTGTKDFYRLRIGEYRIGLALEGGTFEFIRCLPRRDLYRYFP